MFVGIAIRKTVMEKQTFRIGHYLYCLRYRYLSVKLVSNLRSFKSSEIKTDVLKFIFGKIILWFEEYRYFFVYFP
jgi:hypothetical protein